MASMLPFLCVRIWKRSSRTAPQAKSATWAAGIASSGLALRDGRRAPGLAVVRDQRPVARRQVDLGGHETRAQHRDA